MSRTSSCPKFLAILDKESVSKSTKVLTTHYAPRAKWKILHWKFQAYALCLCYNFQKKWIKIEIREKLVVNQVWICAGHIKLPGYPISKRIKSPEPLLHLKWVSLYECALFVTVSILVGSSMEEKMKRSSKRFHVTEKTMKPSTWISNPSLINITECT